MTYNKPSIEVLGEAVSLIQGIKQGTPVDDSPRTNDPAYDLDE